MIKSATISIFILIMVAVTTVSGQKPIPSWNVPVYHLANFQELALKGGGDPCKGKRVLHVVVRTASSPSPCQATVWAYSLDGLDVLGPFGVNCDEPLAVEIDEREWGEIVRSEDHVSVDTWIDAV